MTRVDELESTYQQAERRLRFLLFGDGSSSAGVVKGEERRLEAMRFLRRMRDAFEALTTEERAHARTTEARVADLEEELRRLASPRSREAREADS